MERTTFHGHCSPPNIYGESILFQMRGKVRLPLWSWRSARKFPQSVRSTVDITLVALCISIHLHALQLASMETGISNARATGPPEAASTPNPKSKSDTSTRHESARADVPDQKRSHSKARRPNSSDNATGGGRGGRGGRPGKKRNMGRSEWA